MMNSPVSVSNAELMYDDKFDVAYKIRKIGFPVAVFAAFVLLITCIVLAVLYSKASSRTTGPTAAVIKYDICDSTDCFHLGMDLVKRINKSINPCEDFYTYACGGWQKMHALKNNQTYTSGFTTLAESNYRVIKKALENAALNYSTNQAVMKTVRVYNSCMNTDAVDARGIVPLTNLIRELGGWSVSGNYNDSVSIVTRMGKAARNLNVNSFLGVTARTDMYDSTRVLFQFTPATLGMSADYYTSKDADKTEVREAYKTYMKSVGLMLGGGVPAEIKMMRIFNFEVMLAKIASGKNPDDELIESLQSYRRSQRSIPDIRMSLTSFCVQTGFSCSPLKKFLNIVFSQRSFTGFEKLIAFPVAYFSKLATLYTDQMLLEKTVIADYIMWRVVNQYMGALPSNVTALKDKFTFSITGSSPALRWEQCINKMMTPFDMPLGLLFVNAHFNDDAKTTVEEMTELVRQAFINKLPSQSWMDSNTQGKAKEKALAIKVDIGYPAFIKNPAKLDAKYQMLITSDNLFENYRAANNYVRLKNVNTYGKPVDQDEWFYGPAMVNGYYSPNQNRIVFLAGIIQPPFYEPRYPRYLKYGAIGMVIGHEITHGFDSSGRLFDKNGNIDDWWSYSSTLNFANRAKCLVRQYNKYDVFGKHINGSQTLNENIADNGGIKIAYEAYQLWTRKHGQEKILPGLGLSPEQLFFVGFAQPWCSIYTKKPALRQLKTDSHSFNKFRVLGTLSNYDKFSKAFKCSSGSAMNPSTKCSVW